VCTFLPHMARSSVRALFARPAATGMGAAARPSSACDRNLRAFCRHFWMGRTRACRRPSARYGKCSQEFQAYIARSRPILASSISAKARTVSIAKRQRDEWLAAGVLKEVHPAGGKQCSVSPISRFTTSGEGSRLHRRADRNLSRAINSGVVMVAPSQARCITSRVC
jgi:hypothetical protein